jgi:hypothetical protein
VIQDRLHLSNRSQSDTKLFQILSFSLLGCGLFSPPVLHGALFCSLVILPFEEVDLREGEGRGDTILHFPLESELIG